MQNCSRLARNLQHSWQMQKPKTITCAKQTPAPSVRHRSLNKTITTNYITYKFTSFTCVKIFICFIMLRIASLTCFRAILWATLISCFVLRAIGLPGTIPKALKDGFFKQKFFWGLIRSGFNLNDLYIIGVWFVPASGGGINTVRSLCWDSSSSKRVTKNRISKKNCYTSHLRRTLLNISLFIFYIILHLINIYTIDKYLGERGGMFYVPNVFSFWENCHIFA